MSRTPREHAVAALTHLRAAERALEAARDALEGPERGACVEAAQEVAMVIRRARNLALYIGGAPAEIEEILS